MRKIKGQLDSREEQELQHLIENNDMLKAVHPIILSQDNDTGLVDAATIEAAFTKYYYQKIKD